MVKKSVTFQGKAKPYGKGGHYYESRRHSLQAKGFKTGRKAWEKIGDVAKPRFQSMYGLKNKQDVIWLDNWGRKNWAIVRGKEISPRTYKEENIITNVGSKKEAKDFLKKYLESPDTDKDSVPDKYDCAPLDPTKQDLLDDAKEGLDEAKWYVGLQATPPTFLLNQKYFNKKIRAYPSPDRNKNKIPDKLEVK